VIEAPAILLFAWLLGLGERGEKRPPPGVRPPPGKPEVEELPDIGAWPRAVPKNGEKPIKQTGGNDPLAWRLSRYAATIDFLSNDDRSIDALTSLVESSSVEHGNFAVNEIAISVVAHWDIETASGTHEYNSNVGGVLAVPGQQYFRSLDVGSNKPVAFCAYDSMVEGIADYFGVLSYERYASALVALLMLPSDPGWFSELGWAGYYGMDPVQAEQIWVQRRAIVAVDVVAMEGA
jgi:hypothetical protein